MKKLAKKIATKSTELNRRQNALILLFVLLFAIVGTLALNFTHAATPGTLSLSAATSTVGLGGTITVDVYEDSLATTVNAVQANLSYDQTKLQYLSIDQTASKFSVAAQASGGNGKVSIARGSITPLTGKQLVATVSFKAIAAGSAGITFDATSALLTSTDNSNVLSSTSGLTLLVKDVSAPSAPTNLTSSAQTLSTIALNWTAATDNVAVSGYKIFRNGTQVATTAGTTYTSTGLTPNTVYTFTVSSYDAAGNSSVQATGLSVRTKADTTAPSTPSAPTAGTTTLNSIVLSWPAASDDVGVIGYNIYRNGAKIGTSAATTFTDNGLTPNTSYTYTVSAYDASGHASGQSATVQIRTKPDTSAPSAPLSLIATPSSTTTLAINLRWTASSDNVSVAGYNIYRNGAKIATITTNSYVSTGLTAGVAYSYQVEAFDAAGNSSAKSNIAQTTISLRAGDVNGDGKVGVVDLSIMVSNFTKTSATRGIGDLNNDKIVNIYDLSILCANWDK